MPKTPVAGAAGASMTPKAASKAPSTPATAHKAAAATPSGNGVQKTPRAPAATSTDAQVRKDAPASGKKPQASQGAPATPAAAGGTKQTPKPKNAPVVVQPVREPESESESEADVDEDDLEVAGEDDELDMDMSDDEDEDDHEEEEDEDGDDDEEDDDDDDHDHDDDETKEPSQPSKAAAAATTSASSEPATSQLTVVGSEGVSNAGPTKSFAELGVTEVLCKAIKELGWGTPTAIQAEALPVAMNNDIIGLAETGSGKTAAYAIPILQALLASGGQRLFACIMAPTRELAFQIGEQFEALGGGIGAKCCVIVGGVDLQAQQVALAKKPHIIIGTPGRIVDHLENTKGFSLRTVKFLVLDEADRMLSLDFEEEINKILELVPQDRRTYLYSATMTSKVAKLQRASLKNPVKIEVSTKYTTVSTLVQQYMFVPLKYKDCYLAFLLNEFAGQGVLVFVSTCSNAQRLTILLRHLGFSAIALHGQLKQSNRLAALNKFKSGQRQILIATDVASRGLDIPAVDLVVNYDIPTNGKDYVQRVGRTARAGRAGRAVTIVTQYDVDLYQRIEKLIGKRLNAYPCEEEMVLVLLERVTEAQRVAAGELRETAKKSGRGEEGDDDETASNVASAVLDASKSKRKRLSATVQANKSARHGTGGGGGRGHGGGGKRPRH